MKFLFLRAACLLSTSFIVAQSLQKEVQHPDIATKLFHSQAKADGRIKGSPYAQKMFAQATVENLNIKAYMRYNTYRDEFEFISPKNDTLILDKIEDFSSIVFNGLNRKYVLTPYTANKKLIYGYLIQLTEKGKMALYKKENIGFVEEKIAKTSLEVNMPAKYSALGDSYFFRDESGMVGEFPSSKKNLIKAFPDRKDAIETYVKQNKTDFDNEADLIRLFGFLAQ